MITWLRPLATSDLILKYYMHGIYEGYDWCGPSKLVVLYYGNYLNTFNLSFEFYSLYVNDEMINFDGALHDHKFF